MAVSLELGSKPDVFLLDGNTWLCSSGLPSDVIVEVGEICFRLHKFPLVSRSALLEKVIDETQTDEGTHSVLQLHEIPGGAKVFLLVVKFCYGVRIELNPLNVVSLRCTAEFLQMSEDYGEGNLISKTENFLDEVFGSWESSLASLKSCEEVLSWAEELHIVNNCINSMAAKVCLDASLVNQSISEQASTITPNENTLWNGIQTTLAAQPSINAGDWWYQDASSLTLPYYKRLIRANESRGMKAETIAGSVIYFAKKYLPMIGRDSGSVIYFSPSSANEEKSNLVEEIVDLLPDKKGVVPTKFLLRLLKTSIVMHCSRSCQVKLEKRIGAQLDQACFEDLLIPSMECCAAETLYDVDRVKGILDHFLLLEKETNDYASTVLEYEGHLAMGGSRSLTPMTTVANLMDSYLAEIATDVNLKLSKFEALASTVPEHARTLDDGIYRAIDIYLQAHTWLTDSEKEQVCRLMNCQKLSLEGSTHAAQNQRLPLRVIVQVLFFEQLRLRTSIAGCFFVSDSLDASQSLECPATMVEVDDMKERVSQLERECNNMKQELHKFVKNKRGWNLLLKRLGLRLRSMAADQNKLKHQPKQPAIVAESKLREADKCVESGLAKLLDYEHHGDK